LAEIKENQMTKQMTKYSNTFIKAVNYFNNNHVASNSESVFDLSKVTINTAFNLFINYKNNNYRFDVFTKILLSNKKISVNDVIVPIKALLIQSKIKGFENTIEYKFLKQCHKELATLFSDNESILSLSRAYAMDLDRAINELLMIMSKSSLPHK
jgi:hypothetical protein